MRSHGAKVAQETAALIRLIVKALKAHPGFNQLIKNVKNVRGHRFQRVLRCAEATKGSLDVRTTKMS